MKKLISFSAAVMITAFALAQDTSSKQGFPPPAKMDTVPTTNKWNNDTSSLGKSNKWSDTSMNRKLRDSSINSNNTKWPDTSMQHAKDSMTTGTAQAATTATDATTSTAATAGTSANAAATTATAATTQPVVEDKVIMKDEKIYVVKSGDSTVLADSLTLPSGAVVKSDASVRFKDGSVTKLKNGQYISLKPAAAPAETTTKPDATATTAAPATTTATPDATATTKTPIEDKVVMKDDQVFVIKNGDSTVLEDSIQLKSGAVVKKDGSVTFKNGSTTKLKNGQFIALNPPASEGKKSKATKKKES